MSFFLKFREGYIEEKRDLIDEIVDKIRSADIKDMRIKNINSIGGMLVHEPEEHLFLIDINDKFADVKITDDLFIMKDSTTYSNPSELSSFLNSAKNSQRLKNISIISVPERYDAATAFSEILKLFKKT